MKFMKILELRTFGKESVLTSVEARLCAENRSGLKKTIYEGELSARLAQLARAQVSYFLYDYDYVGNPEVASSSLASGTTFFFIFYFFHSVSIVSRDQS